MLAIDKKTAQPRFDRPHDRMGEVILVSEANMTIGPSADHHDLTARNEQLRSHGELNEQTVPFIIKRNIDLPLAPKLCNFDAFFMPVWRLILKEDKPDY